MIVVEVDAVIPDADPSEPCYPPEITELLRQVEQHAIAGDVEWLRQHGRAYRAIEAA